jgi:hypothetical protein
MIIGDPVPVPSATIESMPVNLIFPWFNIRSLGVSRHDQLGGCQGRLKKKGVWDEYWIPLSFKRSALVEASSLVKLIDCYTSVVSYLLLCIFF